MKVLQINTVMSIGSTGRITRDISDLLTKKKIENTIAYGRYSNVKEYKTIKIGNRFDLLFHFLVSFLFNKHGYGSKRATKKFVKSIEKYDPDIIQLHNIHGYYINMEELFNYFAREKKTVVWLLHDTWAISGGAAEIMLNGNKVDYESKNNKGNLSYPKAIKRFNYYKNLKTKEQLFNRIDNLTIVTPSNWLNDIISSSFLKENRIITIYNGVDTSLFKPLSSELREKYLLQNKKVVLAVANVWNNSKGLGFIRRLSKILSKDFQIVIIGLTRKQQNLFSEDVITITKTNDVQELIKWYTVADIFINPTLNDNFPSVNLESLSCGTPIITYETGGSPEAVTAETGKVIEKNNEKLFIEAILNAPLKDEEIIMKCVGRAEQFKKEKQYEKYIKLYQCF